MTDFERKNYDYSMKNIVIPSEETYMKSLLHETERAITRLRWRAIFFLAEEDSSDAEASNEESAQKETYGFKSNNTPPPVSQLAGFEHDWWKIVESVQFTDHRSNFQRKLARDVKNITRSQKLLVPADKTWNWYRTKPEVYSELVNNAVTKHYKKTNAETVSRINLEAKNIAEKLDLDDRIEIIAEKNVFVTLKDHKQNFQNQPQCRLINPTKS